MTAAPAETVKRYLPWLVATVLFMEQLDSTIVNTAVPSMVASLNVTPLRHGAGASPLKREQQVPVTAVPGYPCRLGLLHPILRVRRAGAPYQQPSS